MGNADLVARGLKSVWHPCTQMKDHESLPLVPIKRGEGVWLEDFENNRYIDAVSSWWVNLFGHANPRINAAIVEQIEQLEHVILAGFTHEPVVRLSERLIEVTPPGLNKCFYADNGSSAVEAALKMSYHYWKNCGQPAKKNFVNLSNSYHGETLGALALGDVALYKETYHPLLMDVITAPSPDAYHREPGESEESYALRQFAEMEKILAERHEEICAVVVEPLIQCAGGMRMHHPVYHTKLREACDRYHVHLIADEIAVGFGRTGTMFALEQASITPDFMCLSKGLTAGYLPLSVVLTTDKVYDAFYDDYNTLKAFLHSHSYTGNPIGCAVALATLDIFRDDRVIESNRELSACMSESVAHLADHPNVGDIRQCGMTLAIEMVKDKTSKTPFPWQERRGVRVYQHALTRQALLRPLGNVVYFMPPYIITKDQIRHLAQVATEGIEIAVRD
ncbi:adenosylmethionine--8-amino-7-oxononanoate transaminase [Marinobacter sp. X15-166B]|uniref:adenosylmethionine--8-amino-7-oxononanoate transaminase n=1 Tax=Marinobacter sp. X15-166B TaxID=1897620 RepID=UPI00085BF391|nr:adenosylmethionine--8-amino-7-oxononanoate transaminase [Marinobacter sp. X15-166B]OEY67884.1 adenosylmethionine--8-amino-7-oxononanoate transaminase [Marinobacter sp. X15-166B]